MTTNDSDLVCGSQVYVDRSGGQGHCWKPVSAESLPRQILDEIEGEMIDGGMDECDDYVASNGLHYRW